MPTPKYGCICGTPGVDVGTNVSRLSRFVRGVSKPCGGLRISSPPYVETEEIEVIEDDDKLRLWPR